MKTGDGGEGRTGDARLQCRSGEYSREAGGFFLKNYESRVALTAHPRPWE
jgi:hypothetical protein